MIDFELTAQVRNDLGKGANRRLRREGKVPAIMYGAEKEVTPIVLSCNEVKKQLENEAFYSHVLTVHVDGAPEQVVLKNLQRHPATSDVMHMDLLRITATHQIQMHVPLHFINEATCVGRKAGGLIQHLMNEVEVSCLPKHLPEAIDVDLAHLAIGDAVHLSELQLPEGVVIPALAREGEQDRAVVSVLGHGGGDEEEISEEVEEGPEGAE